VSIILFIRHLANNNIIRIEYFDDLLLGCPTTSTI
jgi:hypothetical protein